MKLLPSSLAWKRVLQLLAMSVDAVDCPTAWFNLLTGPGPEFPYSVAPESLTQIH